MNDTPRPKGPETDLKKSAADKSNPSPTAMLGLGFEFAGVVFVFCLGGWWLDSKFGTSPILLILGLLISMTGGFYKLWRLGKKFF